MHQFEKEFLGKRFKLFNCFCRFCEKAGSKVRRRSHTAQRLQNSSGCWFASQQG